MSATILLVEDVEDNRALAHMLLDVAGYHVIEAINGESALALAHEHRPDLILMDLSLPIMDGWEATRRLRQDPTTRDFVIVALTAHAMSGDQERVMNAGFDGYLPKPIDVNRFTEQVAEYLAAGRHS